MNNLSKPNDALVISYLNLRKALGFIGLLLPFVLMFGRILLEGGGLLNSISGYYHSIVGDIFVGGLCAIGVFLFSYRGYDRRDDLASATAGVAALGVALFPTTPGLTATPRETTIGYLHLFFAAAFFGLMAYICLRLFTKSNKPPSEHTPEKRKRNMVYVASGWTIVVCIVLMLLLIFVPTTSAIRAIKPVLWLETIAVVAFGLAWLTKGEAILADRD
jgi:hypothetical protein